VIPTRLRIALLARSPEERSEFIKLIGNLSSPDAGRVYREGQVSFPVGRLDGFSPSLSSRLNIAYLARLYGRKAGALIHRVEKYSALGKRLDAPYGILTKKEKNSLALVVAFSMPFDFFLLPRFPRLIQSDRLLARLFHRRMKKAGMIVSLGRAEARKYCNCVVVLARGYMFSFNAVDEGFDAFDKEISGDLLRGTYRAEAGLEA
jgi:capsular polysaccharide transport system ATP-binding protein